MRMAVFRNENAYILYDGETAPQMTPDWFTPSFWRKHAAVTGEAPGRGASLFLAPARLPASLQHESPAQALARQWALRPYRRGGLIAKLASHRYVYTGLERTRAFAELRLTAQLHRQGLPVPEPVGACVWRHGLTYEAALITVLIPGAHAFADDLMTLQALELSTSEPMPAAMLTLLDTTGRAIRAVHDAGLEHVDLNARNLLVDEAGHVYVIDLDRCQLHDDAPQGASWRGANLSRLARSLARFCPDHHAACLAHIHAAYHSTDQAI
ncbi:3-deoxy-D-manno-octulosonic acid kinase [Cobetia sp. QF-1]|uniref:3-deoxy-D-manno-octulosonic acid kinase n=2 Tax=Cobetia crustatorum TaxID=553385 RepID=A0A558HS49_9GAMM|nr:MULTISPECIES: 3-deoxy-D-manno-octulosonic acid kinase [Cobetia]TVU71965.1 3-deoxy-D-manno-octulosonic acid kinase [Cobetia crustatorum]